MAYSWYMTQPLTAAQLRAMLKQAGITQKELAERSGYGQRHVRKLLAGSYPITKRAAVVLIAALDNQ